MSNTALIIYPGSEDDLEAPDNRPAFKYLPGEPADELAQAAGRVRSHIGAANYHFYQMGAELIRVRPMLKSQGRFVAWCNHHFELSYDTLNNYMDIVERLPYRLAIDKGVTQTAKYVLSKGDPEQWRVDLGEQFAIEGRLDEKAARIIRYAPQPVVTQFVENPSPTAKNELEQFVTALNKLKQAPDKYGPLITQIEQWGVQSAVMVEFLKTEYDSWIDTRYTTRPAGTYTAIVDDGGVMNGLDWSLPVSAPQAPLMIERLKADRQIIHIEANRRAETDAAGVPYTWTENRTAAVIVGENGVVLQLDPDMAQRLKSLFPNGGQIVFHARLPRKS